MRSFYPNGRIFHALKSRTGRLGQTIAPRCVHETMHCTHRPSVVRNVTTRQEASTTDKRGKLEQSKSLSRIRNNSVNDARYPGIVKVHYGLHHLLGKQGRLIRKVRYGGKSFLDVEVDGVRHTIHAWMADESHCGSLTVGDDPVSSLETLFTISGLLDQEL